MSQIYLGELLINTGSGSGGGSYDDTELRGYIEDLQDYVPEYLTKAEYDALVQNNTVDPNKMYIITDLATQDDLEQLATNADIESAIEGLNAELRSTANSYYAELSADLETLKSDIVSEKNTAVSAVTSQQTTSVNAVKSQQTTSVNAVKSQQTTSVNAVKSTETTATNSLNSIVSNAQTTLQNKIDNAPKVVIMTVGEYEALDSVDRNTVYILKPNPTETSVTT